MTWKVLVKLPPNLRATSLIEAICNSFVCKTGSVFGQSSATRSGWFQAQPPDGGSSDGVQTIGAALSGMGCTIVHLDNRFHEGVRQNQTPSLVDIAGALWNWTCIR